MKSWTKIAYIIVSIYDCLTVIYLNNVPLPTAQYVWYLELD